MSTNKPLSVIQEWAQRLTFMQQSVLITAVRGPDGISKNHVAKILLRWLRRCFLYSAFESKVHGRPYAFLDPVSPGGGSFTGPMPDGSPRLNDIVDLYLSSLDEIPHHFQLHFMHAAEILGYKYPDDDTRAWWNWLYTRLVNDMHLNVETEEQMDRRLGDFEATWREAEEVVAR